MKREREKNCSYAYQRSSKTKIMFVALHRNLIYMLTTPLSWCALFLTLPWYRLYRLELDTPTKREWNVWVYCAFIQSNDISNNIPANQTIGEFEKKNLCAFSDISRLVQSKQKNIIEFLFCVCLAWVFFLFLFRSIDFWRQRMAARERRLIKYTKKQKKKKLVSLWVPWTSVVRTKRTRAIATRMNNNEI